MRDSSETAELISNVAHNIQEIMRVEQDFFRRCTGADRVSDLIGRFAGSLGFVVAHLLLLSTWIGLNAGFVAGIAPFDPFPFSLLALAVSIEAVFLSAFVLMIQNRQNHSADHRSHLHLQIGLLAEQETTKILQMLHAICDHLGLDKPGQDQEFRDMVGKTPVGALAQELTVNLKKAQAEQNGRRSAKRG